MTNETGLPALPEGYFWRVRHLRCSPYKKYPYAVIVDSARLEVQLIHVYTKVREGTTLKRNWRGKSVDTPHTYQDAIEDSLFTEGTEGTNPIAVRNAANRIMKQWEKAKVRDALISDYPPKILDVE